jgi:hypothetical protein
MMTKLMVRMTMMMMTRRVKHLMNRVKMNKMKT